MFDVQGSVVVHRGKATKIIFVLNITEDTVVTQRTHKDRNTRNKV